MQSSPWDPEGVSVAIDLEGRWHEDFAKASNLDLFSFYENLARVRALDLALSQRAWPHWTSAAGEEAAIVGTAMLARHDEWIFPGLRDSALAVLRNMPIDELVVTLGEGRSWASALRRIAPSSPVLGVQLAWALGCARAAPTERATFVMFGEGVTTTGMFHESVMTAVACQAPLVMICRSQLWPGDAVPIEAGQIGDSMSERLRSCGVWTRRTDGADAVAVHAVLSTAANRARTGKGPSLVEVVTTRLSDQVPQHRDPLARLRLHLQHRDPAAKTRLLAFEADLQTSMEHLA